MGIMLSVLATCVGFLEFLAFYTNVRRNLDAPVDASNSKDFSIIRERYMRDLRKERQKVLEAKWAQEEKTAMGYDPERRMSSACKLETVRLDTVFEDDACSSSEGKMAQSFEHHRARFQSLPSCIANLDQAQLEENLRRLLTSKIETKLLEDARNIPTVVITEPTTPHATTSNSSTHHSTSPQVSKESSKENEKFSKETQESNSCESRNSNKINEERNNTLDERDNKIEEEMHSGMDSAKNEEIRRLESIQESMRINQRLNQERLRTEDSVLREELEETHVQAREETTEEEQTYTREEAFLPEGAVQNEETLRTTPIFSSPLQFTAEIEITHHEASTSYASTLGASYSSIPGTSHASIPGMSYASTSGTPYGSSPSTSYSSSIMEDNYLVNGGAPIFTVTTQISNEPSEVADALLEIKPRENGTVESDEVVYRSFPSPTRSPSSSTFSPNAAIGANEFSNHQTSEPIGQMRSQIEVDDQLEYMDELELGIEVGVGVGHTIAHVNLIEQGGPLELCGSEQYRPSIELRQPNSGVTNSANHESSTSQENSTNNESSAIPDSYTVPPLPNGDESDTSSLASISSVSSSDLVEEDCYFRCPSPFPTYEMLTPRNSLCPELLEDPVVKIREEDEELVSPDPASLLATPKVSEMLQSNYNNTEYWSNQLGVEKRNRRSRSRSKTPDVSKEGGTSKEGTLSKEDVSKEERVSKKEDISKKDILKDQNLPKELVRFLKPDHDISVNTNSSCSNIATANDSNGHSLSANIINNNNSLNILAGLDNDGDSGGAKRKHRGHKSKKSKSPDRLSKSSFKHSKSPGKSCRPPGQHPSPPEKNLRSSEKQLKSREKHLKSSEKHSIGDPFPQVNPIVEGPLSPNFQLGPVNQSSYDNSQLVDQHYWRRSPSPFRQLISSENDFSPENFEQDFLRSSSMSKQFSSMQTSTPFTVCAGPSSYPDGLAVYPGIVQTTIEKSVVVPEDSITLGFASVDSSNFERVFPVQTVESHMGGSHVTSDIQNVFVPIEIKDRNGHHEEVLRLGSSDTTKGRDDEARNEDEVRKSQEEQVRKNQTKEVKKNQEGKEETRKSLQETLRKQDEEKSKIPIDHSKQLHADSVVTLAESLTQSICQLPQQIDNLSLNYLEAQPSPVETTSRPMDMELDLEVECLIKHKIEAQHDPLCLQIENNPGDSADYSHPPHPPHPVERVCTDRPLCTDDASSTAETSPASSYKSTATDVILRPTTLDIVFNDPDDVSSSSDSSKQTAIEILPSGIALPNKSSDKTTLNKSSNKSPQCKTLTPIEASPTETVPSRSFPVEFSPTESFSIKEEQPDIENDKQTSTPSETSDVDVFQDAEDSEEMGGPLLKFEVDEVRILGNEERKCKTVKEKCETDVSKRETEGCKRETEEKKLGNGETMSENEKVMLGINEIKPVNDEGKLEKKGLKRENKKRECENVRSEKHLDSNSGIASKTPKTTPAEKEGAIGKEPEPFWLIFSGEYTKAMNKDWHGQHFCCWQCDESLTGQRYVLRDDHPYCVSCYESVFANSCEKCSKIIGIDSKDLSYKDKHWHEACFLCTNCGESLVDKQFGSKSDRIFCGRCYDEKFASRCDGCGQIFRAGTKKMEYKTRQWHEKCFCCVMCKTAIGTQSFIPREQEIYCAKCYEEKYATRCIKCNKVITSGGVTYKNEPWHRECFTCTHCQSSLAGARFTSRDDKPYCAECFGELFAKRCFACSKPITGIGGTKFISFEDRHWHNDCFFCASCRTSLVGRGFITDAEDIICPDCAKSKLM